MIKLVLFILRVCGWVVVDDLPKTKKYVLIGAPHTSNWDFLLMVAAAMVYKRKVHWMGKDTLFIWPISILLRKMGGIAINRRSSSNVVSMVIERIRESDEFILLITPEGTRKKVPYWKSGFYNIALGAGVPIFMGYADYEKKKVGVGRSIMATGDVEADMAVIKNFYKYVSAKKPENSGEIQLRMRHKRES